MMTIRMATLNDVDQIAPLFDAYRLFYRKSSDLSGAKAFLSARLSAQEAVVFVAESDLKIVGFTQLYPLFSSTNMTRLWLLNDLYVDAQHRKKGWGKALLKRAQEHCIATQASGLSLETEKTNAPGNALYPKMGFALDQEHHFYFWENPSFFSSES